MCFAGQPWTTGSCWQDPRSRWGDAWGRILPATLADEPSLLSPHPGRIPFNLTQQQRWIFSL